MIREKISLNTWDKSAFWPEIVEHTAQAARLTAAEKARLAQSLAAEIIAATAYISGCTDPDRIAIAHLTTFIAAIRCPEIYGHRQGESLASRLETGNYYPGGNPEAVKASMLLLELLSLNDHKHDFTADLLNGKTNPLAINLHYDAERERIEREFENLSDEVKENFYKYYEKIIICGEWL